jgi:molybdopterin/thiamine biosynthesis adenylyltransferase
LAIEETCPEKGQVILCGSKEICGEKLHFNVIFSDNFPNEAPVIKLLNAEKKPIIPHVALHGDVCFMERDVSIIDTSNPKGVIEESINRAFSTVEKGLKGKNKEDFFDEIEAYYRDMPNLWNCDSIVFEIVEPKLLSLATWKNEAVVGVDRHQLTAYFTKTKSTFLTQSNYSCILHIPLKSGSTKWIPLPSWTNFWSLSNLREICFKGMELRHHRYVRGVLRRDKNIPVLFSLPLANKTTIHFGVGFNNCKGKGHPLLDTQSKGVPTPILINRMDKDYLTVRGGANSSLTNKKIAVIGCGAIGSQIAVLLAHSGILNVTLIDPQFLSKDNQYRHVLGNDCIGKAKVEGLKSEIERKLPLTNVTAITANFEQLHKDKTFDFGKFDLVIVATANVNTNFIINDYFVRELPGLPVIYTWLDPYGIGGHTLVTNNKEAVGCYHCLYTKDDSKGIGYHNEASFAKSGQSFTKSIGGCNTRFTPFSGLDANKAAENTARIAMQVLQEKITGNPLYSWKGSETTFLDAGFILAARFQLSSEELSKQCYDYHKQQCPSCGGTGTVHLFPDKRRAA